MRALKSHKAIHGVIVTSLYSDNRIGTRAPCVINDLSGGLGRILNVKDFDLVGIFVQKGVQILHLSGLIGSLSVEASEFCLHLARYAKKTRTRISFDLNYCVSFLEGRIFNYISDNCKNNLP